MAMTHRERHMAWLKGEKADRVPDYEFGAWDQAIERWHREGLPAEYKGSDWAIISYFHTDDETNGPSPWVHTGLLPGFEWKVLETKGDTQIIRDGDGATCEMMRPELGASIPKYLRYAIETREDWERMKAERLNPDDPKRIPGNLDEVCRKSFSADYPVSVHVGSQYGYIRNWMGVENLSIALMEEPEWVEDMIEHLCVVYMKTLARLAGKCKADLGTWWEDICFRNGPLLSPSLFTKYVVPRYKRVTDFLRNECGVEFNMLDCDGDIQALVEPWLQGGINVMFPLEAAHTDAYMISRKYGSRVPLRGYYDKRALIAGKEAIDAEFARLKPLMETGLLCPHTDHRVPPDVSWENYVYYRQRKCGFIGKEYREG